MARMILGREIIARVLQTKNIRPYLDTGMDIAFMSDNMNPAYAAVFTGQDIDAWITILRHFDKYSKVMDESFFRLSYPPESYRLVEPSFDDKELVDMANNAIATFETRVGTTEAQRYIEAGDPHAAAEIMLATARKVLHQQEQAAITVSWDRKDFQIEERISLVREAGPGWGVDELDKSWAGSQSGQLIAIIGRKKAGKSTFLLQSAYHAWHGRRGFAAQEDLEPRRVLFVTTEMPEEDIRDTLACYGAGINPGPYLSSTKNFRLKPADEDTLRAYWRSEMSEAAEAFCVVQPVGRFTIVDLEYEIEKFEPDIIYIDGFYFLTDVATGRTPGSSWEAHDNLARDLKNMAMRNRFPIWVTHQAREKQLGKAGGGFHDTAMMGGTGLGMAADMVFTIDKGDDRVVTITNTAARRAYLPKIKGEWDWDEFNFIAYEAGEDDEDDY
jgi:AAA domain